MTLPNPPSTILHAFVHHTMEQPDAVALWRVEGKVVHETISRRTLLAKAIAWSSALRAAGIARGQRVLLALPDGPDFAASLLGTWMVGAIAIPLPPGQAPTRAFFKAADPDLVVARDALAGDLRTVTPEAVPQSSYDFTLDDGTLPRRDDLALVQFSSGPTLRPSGVMLTHRAVVSNVAALAHRIGATTSDVALSWSPLGLDMGLIGGLAMALQVGYPLALLRPESFLVQPVRWLEAIDHLKVTISAAPTFALPLCTRRVRPDKVKTIDLSSWRVVLVGAELVVPEALRAFAEHFAPARFDPGALTPAYGLAEATLAVTVVRPGRGLRTSRRHGPERARLGTPIRGTVIRIVDDDGCMVPDGEVGAIIVRGPSVMSGYLDDVPRTGATLRDGWLQTGDIGYLEQGELVFVGRSKELVIRRGRNVWVEDVEAMLGEVPGLYDMGIFATARPEPEEGTEGLVVLAEAESSPDELRQHIAALVLDRLALKASHIETLPPLTLPRRPDGALDRRACQALAATFA